jgi:hypothetical protein
MNDLDPLHHIFRHVGGSQIHDTFIEPAAFRRKKKGGKLEDGLSVNWVEYFKKTTPEQAVPLLCEIFAKKNYKVGANSRFALLNVEQAKKAAAKHANVSVVLDPQEDDPSHSEVRNDDEALNDDEVLNVKIAEELQKVIITTYPPPSKT